MYSERISSISESPIRKLMPYANKALQDGKNIFYLNIGQPDIKTPVEFFNAIKDFDKKVVEYCPSSGIPELIEAVKKYYKKLNIDFENNEIMITTGGSEALLFSMMVCADPGDEILVAEPLYSNYLTLSKMANIKLVAIETKIEEGFALPSKEKIQSLITNKTKGFLLTNPSNPTGKVYTKQEVELVNEIANENDLFIIADELYRDFIYSEIEFTSIADVNTNNKYVIVDSVSKRYSACGARVGSVASKDQEFLKQMLKLCQSRLSSPTLEQYGAVALYNMPDEYLEDAKMEYKKRRDTVYKLLDTIDGVTYSHADGAFYTMVKLPVESSEEFLKWMISSYDIDGNTLLLTPCEDFYVTRGKGLNEVRLAYVLESDKLEKCITILKGALEEYKRIS